MYSSKNYTDLLEELTAPPLSCSRGFVPAQVIPEPPVRDLGRDSRGPAGRVSAGLTANSGLCLPTEQRGSFPFPSLSLSPMEKDSRKGGEAAYLKAKCDGPEVIN